MTEIPNIVDQYGDNSEFWRIGVQTMNIRECEWLTTSNAPGSRREGEINGPRFTAARDRAFTKLSATETEQATIIDYHLNAAAARNSDDATGWALYSEYSRSRMRIARKAGQ